MTYIEAPTQFEPENLYPCLFLGGGITGCDPWQNKVIDSLKDIDVHVYNPRRADFDINNPDVSKEQIDWEHKYLRKCDVLIFYFCANSVCPITLFELGAALERSIYSPSFQRILVYCEPGYTRKFDVEYQVKLAVDEFYIDTSIKVNPFFAKVYSDYDVFISDLKTNLKPFGQPKITVSEQQFKQRYQIYNPIAHYLNDNQFGPGYLGLMDEPGYQWNNSLGMREWMVEHISRLIEDGYTHCVSATEETGGDNDFLVIDTVKKEYCFWENGFYPFCHKNEMLFPTDMDLDYWATNRS